MLKFIRSVGYALNGIRHAVWSERNIKIQLGAMVLALLLALLLQIPRLEVLIILSISALILSLELTNTAVERLADRVSAEHDETIKVVKDVMAGAVLMASIFSVIIGVVIFWKPLLAFLMSF